MLRKYIQDNPTLNILFVSHAFNKGKGAALQTGISMANGEFILIQDADLEYDPEEINELLKPVLRASADVVSVQDFLAGNHTVFFISGIP